MLIHVISLKDAIRANLNFLAEMLCIACVKMVGCKISGKQRYSSLRR